MEEIGGPILFIIIVAASWILQARKERVERKQAQDIARNRKTSTSELPEETRRQLYGDSGPREAQRKGAGRPSPESAGPPVAPGSDLFETLFGGSDKPQEAQEGDEGWVPVETARRREPQETQPTQRRATATTREDAPPPLPPTAQSSSVEDLHKQRERAARQREAEKQLRKQRRAQAQKEHSLAQKQLEWEHRRRAATKRGRRSSRKTSGQPRKKRTARTKSATPHHELFTGLGDVRRAVILSEILAPPKGFQQRVEPKLFSD